LLGQWNLGHYNDIGMRLGWTSKECIQNFDEETSWGMFAWMTKKEDGSKGDRVWGLKIDRNGPRSCPMVGFSISGIEPSGSAIRVSQSVG
jgi:hypothetical protein